MIKLLDLIKSKRGAIIALFVALGGALTYIGNATSGIANSMPFISSIYSKFFDKKNLEVGFSVDSARIYKLDKPFKANEPGFANQVTMTIDLRFDQPEKIEIRSIFVDQGSTLDARDVMYNKAYKDGASLKFHVTKNSGLPKIIDDNLKTQKNFSPESLLEYLDTNGLDVYGNTKGAGPGWLMICSGQDFNNDYYLSVFNYRLSYLTIRFSGAPDKYCALGSFPVVGSTIYEYNNPMMIKPSKFP